MGHVSALLTTRIVAAARPQPYLRARKRACPPEDVGRIWGYGDLLIAINNPTHPEHREMLEWVGDAFDPAAFNLADVNLRKRMSILPIR